jgi:predicted AlkP superfamily pyrophosphatase or phosphodiesterase
MLCDDWLNYMMFCRFFIVCLCLNLTGFAEEAIVPAKDRTVVLLTVDGFPAWLWHDPTLVMPTLRRLAAEGAVADAMTVSNPSITWINHTTLVTGVNPRKHGVLYNGLLVRQGPDKPPVIEQWRDKADLVRVPTVYDLAHAAGLTTAQVDWVAILNSGTIDAEMLELPKTGGPIERELVAGGALSAQEMATFSKGKNTAWRDTIWTRAATHIIETRKPNLLLLHTLNTDGINHANGPGSYASYTAYAYTDRLIGDVIAALEKAGRKATVIITTDHGFKKVSKIVYPNVILRKEGLLRVDVPKPTTCDAYVATEGGLAFVFVTDPAKRQALLPRLRELFEKAEGVDQVIDGTDAPSLGMPTPVENQGMGDLILFAKAGYAFQGPAVGEDAVVESKTYLGTHGYPASDPELDGVFIAWGYGIKPGVKLKRVSNLDVAPTIAELLGVKLPEIDGRPLTEILQAGSTQEKPGP